MKARWMAVSWAQGFATGANKMAVIFTEGDSLSIDAVDPDKLWGVVRTRCLENPDRTFGAVVLDYLTVLRKRQE